MLGDHHHLLKEFPELKDKIHELKTSDEHFAQLYEEYNQLDDKIFNIEEGVETPSDEYTEKLKYRRVELKDQLYAMLKDS